MPGNKRPRKAYSPKRAAADPLAAHRAIVRTREQAEPLGDDQLRDLALGYHSALDAIRRGAGCFDDLNTLALACNVALVLCDAGLGADWVDKVKDAQVAIVSLEARASKLRGRYVLTGGELQALQALLDLHDAQLESPDCTQGAMTQALAEIKRRMAAGNVMQVRVA